MTTNTEFSQAMMSTLLSWHKKRWKHTQ